MRKFTVFVSILAIGVGALSGCTENQRARKFGGTMKFAVPPDEQFVNATWKDESLWVVTTDREPDHKPRVYYFMEDSSYGLVTGKVVITEK